MKAIKRRKKDRYLSECCILIKGYHNLLLKKILYFVNISNILYFCFQKNIILRKFNLGGDIILKKQVMKALRIFLPCQLIILVLSILFHSEVNLLNYINYSFYLGSLFILTALLLHVVKKGFFDTVNKSFILLFSRKKSIKEEMVSLSKIVTFNYVPLLINGLLIISTMLLALIIYFA